MLLTFLCTNRDRIIAMLSERMRQAAPAYTHMPETELQARISRGVTAFVDALQQDDFAPLDRFITETVIARTLEAFPLAMLHAGFTAFGDILVPLLQECYGDDTTRLLADLQRLHRLKDKALTTLVTAYETRTKAVFEHHQERLQAYSRQLEQQLIRVGDDFQTLQEFNESILQSMTSGLLVADKTTHRILKVNRAMEHFSNFQAADVVGKTVEDVYAGLHGLPIQAFAEEVERYGAITLRKHRLHTDDGQEFYRSIKGQVFYNPQGVSQGVIVLVDDLSTTELLQETFNRYVSPQVLEEVLTSRQRPSLQSMRRQVTVLFCDIRNFSSFATRYAPETVVETLNCYLDIMVDSLFAHQGSLDKFLGDGLLAFFGAPLPQADHPCRAVQAALEIQQRLTDFNARRQCQNEPVLDIGIGINTGEAIVGNIGSEKRMEYTVIGEMVNLAQRLQARARGGEILISDSTLAHVQHLVTVSNTTTEQFKGHQRLVRAHRIGPRNDQST
jgi:PAS domain S-box-containing protein